MKSTAMKRQMQMGKASFGELADWSKEKSAPLKSKKNPFPERKQPFKPFTFDSTNYGNSTTYIRSLRSTSKAQLSSTKELDPILATQEENVTSAKLDMPISNEKDKNNGSLFEKETSSFKPGKLCPLSPTMQRSISPSKSQTLQRASPVKDNVEVEKLDHGLTGIGFSRINEESTTAVDYKFPYTKKVLPEIKTEKKQDADVDAAEQQLVENTADINVNMLTVAQNSHDIEDENSASLKKQSSLKLNNENDKASIELSYKENKIHNSSQRSQNTSSSNHLSSKDTASLENKLNDMEGSVEKVLNGNLNQKLANENSFVIRIFLSSTFSDFKTERNYLYKNAYPVLKSYCQELGYGFEVVDLRWGITNQMSNEHMVEKLCLLEIENCQKISPGVNFVALLGDRYGYRALPAEVEKKEFELLLKIIQEDKISGIDLLMAWYYEDSNSIPPVYCLKPINAIIEEYTSAEEEKRKQGRLAWDTQREEMFKCLKLAAISALSKAKMKESDVRKFISSVTEMEIVSGILTARTVEYIYCIKRQLENYESSLESDEIKRFLDLETQKNKTTLNQELLELRTKLSSEIRNKLKEKDMKVYDVTWKSGDLCLSEENYKTYLDTMCEDFIAHMKLKIAKHVEVTADKNNILLSNITSMKTKEFTPSLNVDETKGGNKKRASRAFAGSDIVNNKKSSRAFTSADFVTAHQHLKLLQTELANLEDKSGNEEIVYDELYKEALHSLHVAQGLCTFFTGRTHELSKIEDYIKSDNEKEALVVFGEPGCGKSSLLSAVVKQLQEYRPNAVCIVRFIGRSCISSLLQVLKSVCKQIGLIYNIRIDNNSLRRTSAAVQYFIDLITMVSNKSGGKKPLVVIIDSVEIIFNNYIVLLNKKFPSNVSIIVSLRNNSNILKTLESKSHSFYLEIGNFKEQDLKNLVEKFFNQHSRTLLESQMEKLLSHLKLNLDPMYVTVLLNATLSWKSASQIETQILPNTIEDALHNMFINLELKYGKKFIEAALGYLTLGLDGLSSVELEDVLSMNNEVLEEVYEYHNPPLEGVVRIPTLMFARMKYDLKEFIGVKLVYNEPKYFWSYEQFADAARKKYINKEEKVKQTHLDLFNLFSVEQHFFKTVNLSKRKLVIEDADRQISGFPLLPQNKRKLTCMIHHSTLYGDIQLVKKKLVFDLTFLECFFKAFGTEQLIVMLEKLEGRFKDTDLKKITQAVRLNSTVITKKSNNLGLQLLCFLREENMSQTIQYFRETVQGTLFENSLVPNMKCSGITNQALKWFHHSVNQVSNCSLTCKKCFCFKKRSIFVFDLETGAMIKIKIGSELPQDTILTKDSKFLFTLFTDCVKIYSTLSGNMLQKFLNRAQTSENLHSMIALSDDYSCLFLANAGRLAKFENATNQEKEIDLEYKPKAAMNLGGAETITNYVVYDESCTLSTHAVKSGNQVLGAVILWNHKEQKIESKLGLPAIPRKNFLHKKNFSSLIITGCENGQIFLVDLKYPKIISDFGTKSVPKITNFPHAYDSSRSVLVAGMSNRLIRVWTIATNTPAELHSFNIEDAILCLDINLDLETIVVGFEDGNIDMLQLTDCKLEKVKKQKIHNGKLKAVTSSFNDSLVTLCDGQVLKQWDISKLKQETDGINGDSKKHSVIHHLSEVCVQGLTFTEDSDYILTGSSTEISRWSSKNGKWHEPLCYTNFKNAEKLCTITVSDLPRLVILRKVKPMITVIDMVHQNEIDRLDEAYDFQSYEDCLQVISTTPDHKPSLLLYDWDHHYLVDSVILLPEINVTKLISFTGTLLTEIDSMIVLKMKCEEKESSTYQLVAVKRQDIGHFDQVVTVKQSTETQVPLTIGNDIVLLIDNCTVSVWNLSQYSAQEISITANAVKDFLNSNQGYSSHCISKGCKYIAVGSILGKIQIIPNVLKQVEMSQITVLKGHKDKVESLNFVNEYYHLLSCAQDRRIILWDVVSECILSDVNVHAPVIHSVVSPDQQYIAAVIETVEGKRTILFSIKK